jgi:hypothetical protein
MSLACYCIAAPKQTSESQGSSGVVTYLDVAADERMLKRSLLRHSDCLPLGFIVDSCLMDIQFCSIHSTARVTCLQAAMQVLPNLIQHSKPWLSRYQDSCNSFQLSFAFFPFLFLFPLLFNPPSHLSTFAPLSIRGFHVRLPSLPRIRSPRSATYARPPANATAISVVCSAPQSLVALLDLSPSLSGFHHALEHRTALELTIFHHAPPLHRDTRAP